MYYYLIKNEFLEENFIKKEFEMRGNWRNYEKSNPKNKISFFYIQGDSYIRIKKYWFIKSYITNKIDKDTLTIGHKDILQNIFTTYGKKKYLMNSVKIELTPNFDPLVYKNYLEKYNVVILKPSEGYGGKQIYVLDGYEQFSNWVIQIKNIKNKENWSTKKTIDNDYINKINWVMEEYLIDPLLIDGRKFHFRPFFIYYQNKGEHKAFIYNKFFLALAKNKYIKKDYQNKDIHDSHFYNIKDPEASPLFLKDFLSVKKYKIIEKQVIQLFKTITNNMKTKCYNENVCCFQILPADIMITKDYKIKLIEINTSPHYYKKGNTAEKLFKNIMYHIIDPLFPPENTIEDPGDFILL